MLIRETALCAIGIGSIITALLPSPAWTASVQILEDGKSISSPLASEFVESRACPKTFEDIEKLKKLEETYDRNPFPVDFSELTVIPLDFGAAGHEAHMPLSCGYNSDRKEWFGGGTVYFSNPQTVQLKSNDNMVVDPKIVDQVLWMSRFVPVSEKEPNLFRAPPDTDGRSWRDGGEAGDLRFVPLGNGVYILTARADKNVSFYGLVFVPTKQNFQKLACEKNDWLKKNTPILEKSEIQDVQAAIRRLFMQGEALESVRALTRYIQDNKKQLPEAAVTRLKEKAKTLLAVVQGKSELEGFKLGQKPCAGFSGADEHRGTKKLGAQPDIDPVKVVTAAGRAKK